MRAMPTGASSKKRWKRCSADRSARSRARSRPRSCTTERARMPVPDSLGPLGAFAEGIVGRRARGHRRGEQLIEIDAPGGDITARQVEPDGERGVDEEEAALFVDGVESDG